MISPLAPANARRLRAHVFSDTRGIGALLREIGSEIGRLGWLTRVGRHGRWVGLRPEVARGAVWGLALQLATDAVDAPEPDAAPARRRRAKTPPTAPPVPGPRRSNR